MPDNVVRVVQRPDYTISLEQSHGRTYVHADVRRWSVAVARAGRADMDALLAMHGGPLYAAAIDPHRDDFDKWRKCVTHFGFRFHSTVTGTDGMRHSIYVRKIKRWVAV